MYTPLPVDVHIAAIEYALPGTALTLEQLAAAGRLTSAPAALRSFGFDRAWVADAEGSRLAERACRRLLENTTADPASIDVLLYAGATPAAHASRAGLLGGFSYPVARLQYELGLVNARTIGISQTGCLGLMTAVRLARTLIVADPAVRRVLCVSEDVLPAGETREVLYNLISDGACAVLVQHGDGPNRLVAERQVTKGYYWDCAALANEIVAAYFPTARAIVSGLLADAGLSVNDIACVIPHNVSMRSWEILLQLTGIPADRLFGDNIAAKGHVISGDNFINLKDAEALDRLKSGDRVLLFNFGFGASWACLLLEH
jgi:3-oxoacyl-[acyl-carrier-protein] synthase III